MTYYALKDSDWAFDDQDEGRAIIVQADTPEEAISKATEMHIKEFPGAGGVTWDVARLDLTGIGDAEWGDDNIPKYGKFRFYDDGLNEPSEMHKRMRALEAKLAAAEKALEPFVSFFNEAMKGFTEGYAERTPSDKPVLGWNNAYLLMRHFIEARAALGRKL